MSPEMRAVLDTCREVRLLHPASPAKLSSVEGVGYNVLYQLRYTLENNKGVVKFTEDEHQHTIKFSVSPVSLFHERVLNEGRVRAALVYNTGFLDSPTDSIRIMDFRVDTRGVHFVLDERRAIPDAVRVLLTQVVFVD